jgi:hypothetical protein
MRLTAMPFFFSGVVASVTNAVKDTVNSITGSGTHANHNTHNI